MSTGFSLHIGLNNVDHAHYGDIPTLRAAVNDALFWESYAKSQGYETTALHDGEATTKAITGALAGYANQMQPGDILLLTYAGHGGEIPNDKPVGFDDERNDQTWCLYDRQLLDDELYECFKAFKEGTRILVVSDSCHSGSVTRADDIDISACLSGGMTRSLNSRGFRSRKLPKEVEEFVNYKNEATYRGIQNKYKTQHQFDEIKASVKLLAACQDDQETLDGENNGIFTEAFIDIFKNPDYSNARCELLIKAVSSKYFFPQPNFFEYGGIIPAFDDGFPFTINVPGAAKVTGYRKPEIIARSRAVNEGPDDQWDTLEQKEPAALLIEVEGGGVAGKLTGGKDATVTNKQTKGNREIYTVRLDNTPNEQAWSAAHAVQTELDALGYTATVEPIISVNPAQRARVTREADANNPDYIKEWPPSLQQGTIGIGWHLDDEHSQLGKALAFVTAQKPDAHVRIAHLDTGYIEGHVALPPKLNKELAHSFVDNEDPNQAIDKMGKGQDGHGLGTITLLAGGKVTKADTFNEFEGFIGGAPLAEVIPLRISEAVVIFNDHNFCDAVDYAIEKGCEVISMSFAGKPSKKMAKAVNKAYEAGIVMVTAASNCWYKGAGAVLPKCVLFPAAFERVIAATGAMYNHKPYDVNFIQEARFNITTKYMQGSWGPPSRMTRALAGYTPNTPWASTHFAFVRSGGGTSSATPEIAAAAALWIAYHREELEQKGYYQPGNQWKKVEAVRYALFSSAARGELFADWEKYYGNGIVKAFDALQAGVADESKLEQSPEAGSSLFGVFELVGSFFKNRQLFRSEGIKPTPEALATELLHLLQTDPQFYKLFATLDLSDPVAVSAVVNTPAFRQQVMASPYASNYLKQAMAG